MDQIPFTDAEINVLYGDQVGNVGAVVAPLVRAGGGVVKRVYDYLVNQDDAATGIAANILDQVVHTAPLIRQYAPQPLQAIALPAAALGAVATQMLMYGSRSGNYSNATRYPMLDSNGTIVNATVPLLHAPATPLYDPGARRANIGYSNPTQLNRGGPYYVAASKRRRGRVFRQYRSYSSRAAANRSVYWQRSGRGRGTGRIIPRARGARAPFTFRSFAGGPNRSHRVPLRRTFVLRAGPVTRFIRRY